MRGGAFLSILVAGFTAASRTILIEALARSLIRPALRGTFSRKREKEILRPHPHLDHHCCMIQRRTARQLANARRLRREMTVAETILWRALRKRGMGAKFRRQVPIGRYFADFVCISAKLIIELDGAPHDSAAQRVHDLNRDNWLRAHGWRILRIPNELVIGESPAPYAQIENALSTTESRDG